METYASHTKKRRIAILTMFYNNFNYGGQLQAWALQSFLENMGFEAEQIKFVYIYPDVQRKGKLSLSVNEVKEKIVNKLFQKIYSYKLQNRKDSFLEFMKEISSSKIVYDEETIIDIVSNYDIFICGGDQIWNDWEVYGNKTLQRFTLDFVPRNKLKLSYAASLGRDSVSEEFLDKLKPGIQTLNAIFVREESSIDILRRITDKRIEVVVDPVILIDVNTWEKKIAEKAIRKKKYIFCYFLGSHRMLKKEIYLYARKKRLEIVNLPFATGKFVSEDVFWGNEKDFSSGPLEFVALIKNADYIFTDSYHAVVFSVLFGKLFWVFDRGEAVKGSNMNSRIVDFLRRYSLENRYVPDGVSLDNVNTESKTDYNRIVKKIQKDRENSIILLKEILDNES